MNPKASVCITTYNLESYIRQTLDSVLMQKTDFDFEILACDDASSDDTPRILQEYEKAHPGMFRLILRKENKGVCRNDYDLIMMARGEYIAWCDGDDFWTDSTKLQRQVEILDTNPQVSCCVTNWFDLFDATGKQELHKSRSIPDESHWSGIEAVNKLLEGKITSTRYSSVLFRKSIAVDYLKKDPDILTGVPHLHNDLAMFCILLNGGSLVRIPEPMVAYRIRTNSLSHSDDISRKIKYSIAYLHLISHLAKTMTVDRDIYTPIFRRNYSCVINYWLETRPSLTDLESFDTLNDQKTYTIPTQLKVGYWIVKRPYFARCLRAVNKFLRKIIKVC